MYSSSTLMVILLCGGPLADMIENMPKLTATYIPYEGYGGISR